MTRPAADPGAYRRDQVIWSAFGALFGFGILNAVLGPALPFLRAELGLSYLEGSLHQVAFAVGGGTAGMLTAGGRNRLSRRATVAAGLTAGGLAGLAIGYGPTALVTVPAAGLVSGAGTAAVSALWAALADRHSGHRAAALSEGEVAVSLAGVLTPTLFGLFAGTPWGWRCAFAAAAVMAVVAAGGVLLSGLPEPIAPAPDPAPGVAGPFRLSPTLVTIFAVVGLEFALSFWLASFLDDDVGLSRDRAAATVAALYAAHLVGRLVTSRLARRVPARPLLGVALGVVVAGSPVLLGATDPVVALVGIMIVGAGTGATFPLASTLHVQASPRGADGALGQILAVAAIGQVTGPLAAGALAQVADLRAGLVVVPACALLAAATLRKRP